MTLNIFSMRGTLLESLMGVSMTDFAQSYWGRTYLHVSGGLDQIHAALGGPWGLSDWRAATERAYRWPGSPRNIQALPVAGTSSSHRRIEPEEIDTVLASGATIIGDVLDTRLSMLA